MEDFIVTLFLMVSIGAVAYVIAYYATKGKPRKTKEECDDKMQELANALGKKIVEVKLLGAGSTDYRSFGGAAVGGMVAGPLGAVVGGTHGKGKQKQRFAIRYNDGSVEIKEVRTNSVEYKNLMKYVSWEDIK